MQQILSGSRRRLRPIRSSWPGCCQRRRHRRHRGDTDRETCQRGEGGRRGRADFPSPTSACPSDLHDGACAAALRARGPGPGGDSGLTVGRGVGRRSRRRTRLARRRPLTRRPRQRADGSEFSAEGGPSAALRRSGRDHTATASLQRRLGRPGSRRPLAGGRIEAVIAAGRARRRRRSRGGRAALLAACGAGELLIGDDPARHGVRRYLAACDRLPRAGSRPCRGDRRRAGRSPRTARYLAAKGFSEAALERSFWWPTR